jgi:hypothetical protein
MSNRKSRRAAAAKAKCIQQELTMTTEYSSEELQQAIADLVEMGLIMDSGERRNGQVVYVATPLGKSPEGRAALEAWERRERGERPS